MPASPDFLARLAPVLDDIAAHYGTPFHIYDETGIRETGAALKAAFSGAAGFQEYFAVKALPNPRILRLIGEMGFGFDCSSIPELLLSRGTGARGERLMFTSNNTSREEFEVALADGGCILNLDDISLVGKTPLMPELISFRYNPGAGRSGNAIIGSPVEAKYGVAHEQIVQAYCRAQERGARRFGLHTMLISNERDYRYMAQTINMLLELIGWIGAETGIRFEFINIGGGLGIPYRPEDEALDIQSLGREAEKLLSQFGQKAGYTPALHMESGRFMTGPHGVLVTRAINHKQTYRHYVGVDASMSALMRPGMYGAYHHVTVHGKNPAAGTEIVDVVGALCENNDKFAVQRALPPVDEGDILLIYDSGAHGHSMGFTYNGRLRPKELLLRGDGSIELIRRAETLEDYFATLNFAADVFLPDQAS